jgi:hypothetical protein
MIDPEETTQPNNIDLQPATPFGSSDGGVPTLQPVNEEIPTAQAIIPTDDSPSGGESFSPTLSPDEADPTGETKQPIVGAPPSDPPESGEAQPVSPDIIPTAANPSGGDLFAPTISPAQVTETDDARDTSAAAGSPQWLTSRGATLVENEFASFSSALSGDGSTIALEYKDEQDNARVQAHRYGSDGSWMQVGTDITGIGHLGGASNRLALSGDGNILAVGFPVENCNIGSICGLVRVFTYEADEWRQLGDDIVGERSFGYLGLTVDISDDGMTVAAGAPFSHGGGGNHVGKVRVFRYDTEGGRWEQLGPDLEGDATGDYAGSGVALSADGTIVAYGALQNEAGGLGYVQVFAYDKSVDSYTHLGEKLEGGDVESKLGSAVSLSSDGSTLVVGAVKEGGSGGDDDKIDSSPSFGLVSVFRNENDAWVKIGDDIESGSTGDLFGFSVATSADGNRVVIGAPEDDSRLGSVSVFDLNDGTWALQGQPLEYTNAEVEGVSYELGRSVGISSSGLIVSTGGWFGVEVFEDPLSRASKLDFGSISPFRISSLTTGSVTASPTVASPLGSPTGAPITSPSVTKYRASVADESMRRRQPRSYLHN